ncbi:MAG: adenylate kinase [Chloroflexota bacterium]|nr:adenylate kinase [Chloroflexota bacterium]
MTGSSPLFIVLFGAQGSGKGTQARLIQDEFGIPQIATGDLFRHNLKNETELGQLAKGYMDRGELVPDSVTNAMVRDRLGYEDVRKGAIFDGFPRNTAQAEALEEMLAGMGASITRAVYILVREAELMRRLTGRRVCRGCQATYHVVFSPPKEDLCDRCGSPLYQRDDDKDEAAIQRRLEVYFQDTMPVIEWYRSRNLLAEVDGERSINEVCGAIFALIREHDDRLRASQAG